MIASVASHRRPARPSWLDWPPVGSGVQLKKYAPSGAASVVAATEHQTDVLAMAWMGGGEFGAATMVDNIAGTAVGYLGAFKGGASRQNVLPSSLTDASRVAGQIGVHCRDQSREKRFVTA